MQQAIITGGSSGIGAAMARELSRRGYALALLDRCADLLEHLARELPNTIALPCDVGAFQGKGALHGGGGEIVFTAPPAR